MCNHLQAGYHLNKLYVDYIERHTALAAPGVPMAFAAFGVAWNKWCDRYSDGAASSPSVWGDAFLGHEFSPLR